MASNVVLHFDHKPTAADMALIARQPGVIGRKVEIETSTSRKDEWSMTIPLKHGINPLLAEREFKQELRKLRQRKR